MNSILGLINELQAIVVPDMRVTIGSILDSDGGYIPALIPPMNLTHASNLTVSKFLELRDLGKSAYIQDPDSGSLFKIIAIRVVNGETYAWVNSTSVNETEG